MHQLDTLYHREFSDISRFTSLVTIVEFVSNIKYSFNFIPHILYPNRQYSETQLVITCSKPTLKKWKSLRKIFIEGKYQIEVTNNSMKLYGGGCTASKVDNQATSVTFSTTFSRRIKCHIDYFEQIFPSWIKPPVVYINTFEQILHTFQVSLLLTLSTFFLEGLILN